MRVTWEVEDGYVGKSRPHFTEIDDGDIEAYETQKEKDKFIEEAIQEDFEINISWAEIGRD